MTTQLQKSLQTYGEKLATNNSDEISFEQGFNQAIELMLPLVEALEKYKSAAFEINGQIYAVGKPAEQALADLRKKVGA